MGASWLALGWGSEGRGAAEMPPQQAGRQEQLSQRPDNRPAATSGDCPEVSGQRPSPTESATTPVREIALHDEVCPLPPIDAVVEESPSLADQVPASTGSQARRTDSASAASAYPDTGLLPIGVAVAEDTDGGASPTAAPDWPDPEALLGRLDALAAKPGTMQWATEAADLVQRLGAAASQGSDKAGAIIRQLRDLSPQASALADTIEDREVARELSRADYALKRRVDVWQQLADLGFRGPITAESPQGDPKRLSLYLAEIDRLTGDSPRGRSWREYLLVDSLREWSEGDRRPQDRLPRALAQRALGRLTRNHMSAPQRQFLSSRPLAALRAELQRWTAEPVDPPGLLEHLERYERTGLPSDAGLLAADCRHLVLDAGGAGQQLAERLEANYRNANLRVTVTKELLDRLMPEREPEYAPVHDTVLGRPVNGRSVTFTQVGVQLLPDPDRLRLALEISGEVESLTSSTAGPATFYNDSTSTYTALKPLEIDLNGIRLSPTEVEVDSRTRIRDLQTDFDEIPLLGGLVQKIARSQHDQKQGAATREVKQKISREAQQRIDSEIEDRVGEVSDRLQKRVLDPLEAAGLAPAIIDAETTDERLTIRMRLAGEDQLGGHTPRPQAPSDSLASLQVHESAINNMLQRLELEGRTFTLPKLSEHVTARLGCSPLWEIDPEHEDVTITFAKQNAVGVRLQDGRALLRLAIAKLSKSPQAWRDFEAYVHYRPEVDGRSAMLLRDGNVQLGGGRMATGAQIALRGIFAKVFSSRRAWNLTPEQLASDERLADLEVTQLTIDDGWIGMALGPQRTIVRSAMLRP